MTADQTMKDNTSTDNNDTTVEFLDSLASQLNKRGNIIVKNQKRKRTPVKKVLKSKRGKLIATDMEDQPWLKKLIEEISTISARCERIEVASSKIEALSNEVQALKETLVIKDEKIEQLKSAVQARDDIISNHEIRIDKLEREALADQVIITSPHFENIDSEDEARNHISQVSNIHVGHLAKTDMRRFGKDYNQVLIKTKNPELTSELFRRIRKVRGRSTYISEVLTPRNNKIFYDARNLRKRNENKIHSVYTYKGQVYLKPEQDAPGILIERSEQLAEYETLSEIPLPPRQNCQTQRDNPQARPEVSQNSSNSTAEGDGN